uniref:BRCA1-associated protein n=1 Tax=Phallusia mammillata TaxID=59560 RepID=A0A6F9D776_9ASCI|nr:BRCA1-associated protein [Phallusia mammillata]
MSISFIHIRFSVSSGNPIPSVAYKARCLTSDGGTIKSDLLQTEEFDYEALQNLSPLKPHRHKSRAPPEILLDELDDHERQETLAKLKGLRYARDLTIETYHNENCDKLGEKDMSSQKIKVSSTNQNDLQTAKSAKADVKSAECLADESELTDILKSSANGEQAGSSRPNSVTDLRLLSSPPNITTIPFFCGNPTVEITNGIIQIYKSNFTLGVTEHTPPPETNTLCMLSVPASIDTRGLMEFTAPFIEAILRMKIIRDHTPNQYMVLLTFVSEKHACDFFFNLNNQPYSSLLPDEICHIAFVASVDALQPYNKDTPGPASFLPIPNSTELPDCMVCLERMDESVRGILTILCNHSFHGACLSKWEDLCCPVCRYVQTPEAQSSNKCMVCGGMEDLWICLVCGHVGCGRYTSEHAQFHYLETHHNYAMALSDNRVWDYAGDYFVHRLFQNKEDGKLIEKKGDLSSNENQEAKLEAIQLECMHLLTSQLESQRKYWEEQVSRVEKRAEKDRNEMSEQLNSAVEKSTALQETVTSLEKEKQSLSHRNQLMTSRLYDALKDLQSEREINKSLVKNQDEWKAKVRGLEERGLQQQEEIRELKEQIRDVMFFIEAGETIRNEEESVQEEMRDGQIVVGQSSSDAASRRRGKGRKPK